MHECRYVRMKVTPGILEPGVAFPQTSVYAFVLKGVEFVSTIDEQR